MKHLISFLLLLITSYTASAQFGLKNVQYKFNSSTIVQECHVDGTTSNMLKKLVPGGSKFTIVGTKDGNYIISFLNWPISTPLKNDVTKNANGLAALNLTSGDQKYLNFNKRWDSNLNAYVDRFFLLDAGQLESFASGLHSKFEPSYGTVILPFKIRKDFNFSRDVALSGLGSVKWNVSDNHDIGISALIGPGISAVQVNPENTDNQVTEASDHAAFSLQGGLVFQWKMLQIGVFLGGDWLTTSPKDVWDYQGKAWGGIGVGLAIFSDELTKKKTGKN